MAPLAQKDNEAFSIFTLHKGGYTCALTTTGGAQCWGVQTGGGDLQGVGRSSWPGDVSGLTTGVSAIAVGWGHACALTTTGGVKCWGESYYGQLGDGTNTGRQTPVAVNGLSDGGRAIAAGGSHTCVLTTTGGVKCWGENSWGQLGNGTILGRSLVDVKF